MNHNFNHNSHQICTKTNNAIRRNGGIHLTICPWNRACDDQICLEKWRFMFWPIELRLVTTAVCPMSDKSILVTVIMVYFEPIRGWVAQHGDELNRNMWTAWKCVRRSHGWLISDGQSALQQHFIIIVNNECSMEIELFCSLLIYRCCFVWTAYIKNGNRNASPMTIDRARWECKSDSKEREIEMDGANKANRFAQNACMFHGTFSHIQHI